MTEQSFLMFGIAALLLLLAHVLRAMRQATLFPRSYLVRRFDLLLGLAISYAVNSLIPFRIGEVIRVLYVGRVCKIRYSFVTATVLAERLLDLLVVALLYAVYAAFSLPAMARGPLISSLVLLVLALAGIGAAVGVGKSAKFRWFLWTLFSVFNNQIRFLLLDIAWSYSELVTGGVTGRGRFLTLTPIMWIGYSASYFCFAKATGLPMGGVVLAMLGSPLRSTSESLRSGLPLQVTMLVFALIPVVGIIVLGLLRQRSSMLRVASSLVSGRYANSLIYHAPLSDRFSESSEYEAFLVSRFSSNRSLLTEFSMNAIADGAVQRIFPGGSDAVTALVEVNGNMLIRKFAMGDAGEKLQVQAEWLQRYQTCLPLVEVSGTAKPQDNYFLYDMPYVPTSIDFYDVIHTANMQDSQHLLDRVIDHMLAFHQEHRRGPASEETVERYLAEKAVSNAKKTLEAAADWLPNDGTRYILNGREYDLSDWRFVQDLTWLRQQITRMETSQIHGDLTIENIIVSRESRDGFYIIDPNPSNIFDTPMIDWAKLMQSLHLGYEGLNRVPTCTLRNGELQLVLTRSLAYNELHSFCLEKLERAYGEDIRREISFHEIINYLRLTPYKIRQSPSKGLAFFACSSMLIRNYLEKYA